MLETLTDLFLELMNFYTIGVLLLGVAIGIIGGALPGISPSMTIALLLPVSLYMPTSASIAMLLGAYQGAMFGGSVAAILINTPGTASSAATLLDGKPMAQNGQAGKALKTALYSSCAGGVIGVIILIVAAKWLASVALSFGPPEYFGLMLLSLTLIAGVSGDSLLKGVIAGALGLLVASVGTDQIYGAKRFVFGNINLSEGFSTLAVFIGIFAFSEIITQLARGGKELDKKPQILNSEDNKLSLGEFLGQKVNILVSGILGALIGVLPGIGGSTACFIAYAQSQKRSKYPEKYGTGIIDGVAAPEAANNASCGGALVPMLTLGIPGDVVTSILVGAFIAQGIKPGPLLFVENIEVAYGIYITFGITIIALALIGTLSIPVLSKVVSVKKSILMPLILVICIVGTYSVRSNFFDSIVMVMFGVVGYLLKKYKFPLPPMVIAFVLGSQIEYNLQRSFILSNNSYSIFFTRPLSAVLIIVAVVSVVIFLRSDSKNKKNVVSKTALK